MKPIRKYATLALLLLFASPSFSADRFPNRYDFWISKCVNDYWPMGPDWYWWKAQLYQESLLDPDAVSPVGARGIAQFMPRTWAEISGQLGFGGHSADEARYAIEAGCYYMAKLKSGWSAPRPMMDRHYLAAASYNAGFGNILKAQKACGGPSGYEDIICCLPAITGRHSAETITYIKRIKRWQGEMR